jgi:hypothetical protein
MPIYRLEPVENLKHHDDWRLSGLGPMSVWLHAHDKDDARRKMQLATITTVEGYEKGQLVPDSPWLNSAVVSCDRDDSHKVPKGSALLGNGSTIEL